MPDNPFHAFFFTIGLFFSLFIPSFLVWRWVLRRRAGPTRFLKCDVCWDQIVGRFAVVTHEDTSVVLCSNCASNPRIVGKSNESAERVH